jgi:hypothetical protein
MASNAINQNLDPVRLEEAKQIERTKDESDLARGLGLLGVLVVVLLLLWAVYISFHHIYPAGFYAPTQSAINEVEAAKKSLAAASVDQLNSDEIASQKLVAGQLRLYAPQLGAGENFTSLLDQIDTLLGGKRVSRTNLAPLYDRLVNIIMIGPAGFVWPGSRDRWLEMAFWTVIGTLMFLLYEITTFYHRRYGCGPNERNFVLFTPWYITRAFRGPFIALLILAALTSVSFDAIGVSLNLQSVPVEVLVVMAGILGFYARVAEKQLDIIAQKLLPDAWAEAKKPKAYPLSSSTKVLTIEPQGSPLKINAGETKNFSVQPSVPVRWVLQGPAERKGTVEGGKYTAPAAISDTMDVYLLAIAEDEEYDIARVKIRVLPSPDNSFDSNGNSASTATPSQTVTEVTAAAAIVAPVYAENGGQASTTLVSPQPESPETEEDPPPQ